MINSYLREQIRLNFPYNPTENQLFALKKLSDFLFDDNKNTLLLIKGYAGTGKTSLIGALVKTMNEFQQKSILLAPTGRAAKVFSNYAEEKAFTIHKKIYRQKAFSNEPTGFVLNENMHKDTLFIVDEASMLRPLGIEDTESVLAINNEFLQRTTTKTRLIEGAIEILDYLRPSYRLFILSNGFHEVQLKKLTNSGLAPYFGKMILSEDAGIQKPQKGIFDYALVNTNSIRHESLMIGDSWEADIEGAYNARIDQLWLNPSKQQPRKFTPTYTVGSLDEIKTIL